MAVRTRSANYKHTYDEFDKFKDICAKYRMTKDEMLAEWINETYAVAFPTKKKK